MACVESNNPGRPSKRRQFDIYLAILGCFEEGLSEPSAAKKVSINIKTARKYYDKIVEQRKEQDSKDMFERQERIRIQIISTFDKDIEEFTDLLERIRKEIEWYTDHGKAVPKYLFDRELDVMKYRAVIKDRKAGYTIRPTPKEEYAREMKSNDSEEVIDDKT